jgi:hypothetical protein
MGATMQTELFKRTEADIRAEIAHVMSLPDGDYLSPEAQEIYEADGAERFRSAHGKSMRALLEVAQAKGADK